ncbi:MAG TPA: DUF2207 domain-containing protein [Abditibacteriaceae bacterium]|jgi:uncharacterized membrane protein YgcG
MSLRFCLLLVVTCFFASTQPARAEVIRSFDAEVRLNKDTSMDVSETIVMDFQGSQRHGIYRKIPVTYKRYGGKYSIYLKLLAVTDEKGTTQPYTTSRNWGDFEIKIGDPDKTISGAHTYRIRYLVRRTVNFFNKAPEVYWNVTGNDWPFAMQRVSAHFYAPPGVTVNRIKTASFVGPPGSTTPGGVQREANSVLFFTKNLPAGDGLTFVAGLPAGSVVPPTALQNALWFLADWWPLILFPLLTLSFILARYLSTGRDVDRGLAISVEWNPPKNLTPAEVGTLVDERCDMADIVSTLVDLAARGYLTIEELETTKFLFFSSKDYRFVRRQVDHDIAAEPLLLHEKKFLEGLFGSASYNASGTTSVTLSSLKNKFYAHLPEIRSAIYESLTKKNLFVSNPDTTRKAYTTVGIIMIVLGFTGGIFGMGLGMIPYGIGVALSGLIVLASARAMPAKTATGSRALRECRGFQRFVQMAEKDRIRVLAQNDPTIFGRLLPYAMVLGVADQWADAFRDLLTQPPDWYVGPGYGYGHPFSSHAFVNDLGSGMNSMGSTFSSAPSSSGGSGGSGFSGGGSGGGFGGGGGGSW